MIRAAYTYVSKLLKLGGKWQYNIPAGLVEEKLLDWFNALATYNEC